MSERNKEYPFEIIDFEPDETAELKKYHDEDIGFVRIGPKGYVLARKFKEMAADIYNMPVRSSDIYVVTFPRSGTTWTSEMVYLLGNDLDYEKAAAAPILTRFPFLEFSMLIGPRLQESLEEASFNLDSSQKEILSYLISEVPQNVAILPSPRFIKSHLPLSLLPPTLLDTAKVVYVARNPRDVAVSYYNLNKLFAGFNFTGSFKTYWNFFITDKEYWCPYWEHLKEAWEKRHHPNLLFIFYEDLIKDLPGGVRRVASFLGKELTDDQVLRLCDHLSIASFKVNNAVNDTAYRQLGFFTSWNQPFIRKGTSGGWRDYFDEEMAEQAERWISDNLRNTDMRFPE